MRLRVEMNKVVLMLKAMTILRRNTAGGLTLPEVGGAL